MKTKLALIFISLGFFFGYNESSILSIHLQLEKLPTVIKKKLYLQWIF